MQLSPRESQIVSLLQQGQTNKEIGQALALSPHTVRDYISAMLARFGVKSRAALVVTLVSAKAHRTIERRARIDRRAESATGP